MTLAVSHNGKIVHLGEWDDNPHGEVDAAGISVVTNPWPHGAVYVDIDVCTDDDGGLRPNAEWVTTGYRTRRRLQYPDIGEQLDALYHAGLFPPEMAARIRAIKDMYPKPEE